MVIVDSSLGAECPEGYVPGLIEGARPKGASDDCILCKGGTYADAAKGSCEQCLPGTFQVIQGKMLVWACYGQIWNFGLIDLCYRMRRSMQCVRTVPLVATPLIMAR